MEMDRNFLKGLGKTVAVLLLTAGFATANAASVTISNAMDGNGAASLFDVSGITQSGVNGEIIELGISNFIADGSFGPSSAVDTLFLTLTAPTGMRITSIGYSESGEGETETGVAMASGSLIADGMPTNFLTQIFNTTTSRDQWTITKLPLVINNKQTIDVSITNSLFAYAFVGGEIAEIEKTSATLTVGLSAIPIPPAIWKMGAAITALVTVGRRGGQAS